MSEDHTTPQQCRQTSDTISVSSSKSPSRASSTASPAPEPLLPSSTPLAAHSAFAPNHVRPLRSSPTGASAGATKNAMAASPFLAQPPSFRPSMTSQSSFATMSAGTTVNAFERDQPSFAVGTPFNNAAPSTTSVLIRRLPLNTSKESIRLMLVFCEELVDVDVLPAEHSEDPGFRSALVKVKTPAGAQNIKSMLDGKSNISNDAELMVEILGGNSQNGRRYTNGDAPTSASSSATSSATSSRQPSRFNGAGSFGSVEAMSPPISGAYGNEMSGSDTSNHFQNIFSPQSPIGNHLTDQRTRMSGKSLINDAADDDETGELLKDPLAYAENGAMATQARRATAPQLPISRMAGLSLNTNGHPMAPYGPSPVGQLSAHTNTMSPTMLNGAGTPTMGYLGGHRFPGHSFPPVNPADQNPPCNTLYVGNLPIDTSEEELKATFSKQRGYKRLCFRTKQNGPMCFVEFEDVSFATKALHELYGHMLHNSVKGGIRLSFSKNPLGVRSGQNPVGAGVTSPLSSMNSMMNGNGVGNFATANGPPPGLSAPPGLGGMGTSRSLSTFSPVTSSGSSGSMMTGSLNNTPSSAAQFSPPSNIWNTPNYGNTMMAGGPTPVTGGSSSFPSFMMGR
ncbi:cell cycle RNA binding protein whi3 [Pyricularia oryzae]|uniref:Uncharacterized protein n=1 Tax=Pyricularia oryzae TaxID=318829 RepID=A0A4P7NSZ5_PYROR|nr:hypothetical protein MCOR01_010056 [Pyricularia oryzae]KAI6477169.1 hypothetical protein MCOR17_000655 [Pyricularia oryzae]KAI6496496.1 hypothetical protein MCOR13_007005 [Pyricularia oryzae]KAI6570325.1 hypothetical protein MCOR04_008124 [Pyricularia oryzae]QBZ65624.1 hypothetical protein PoMZ_12587 [Pyricularia oryzae]